MIVSVVNLSFFFVLVKCSIYYVYKKINYTYKTI